ncbi:MAG: type II secretion system protein [Ignavibacteriae bacterium]|nr:type II secretion system protein [Ignavibacteriota bacterium]
MIEIILVIALMLILLVVGGPVVTNFLAKSNLNSTTNYLFMTISKAQTYGMSRKNDENWGVCVQADQIVLFSGTCTSPTFTETYNIPKNVTVGFDNDLIFSNLRGEPDNEVNVTLATNLQTKTLSVNSAGGINIQE